MTLGGKINIYFRSLSWDDHPIFRKIKFMELSEIVEQCSPNVIQRSHARCRLRIAAVNVPINETLPRWLLSSFSVYQHLKIILPNEYIRQQLASFRKRNFDWSNLVTRSDASTQDDPTKNYKKTQPYS